MKSRNWTCQGPPPWPITQSVTDLFFDSLFSLLSELSQWCLSFVHNILTNPEYLPILLPILLISDAFISLGIIRCVNFTDIDFTPYMQQVITYLEGERDYSKLKGDTGSLVYPAAHVYIHQALHAITDGGENILLAQLAGYGVYVMSLFVVFICYLQVEVSALDSEDVWKMLNNTRRLLTSTFFLLHQEGCMLYFFFGCSTIHMPPSFSLSPLASCSGANGRWALYSSHGR